MSGLLVGSGVGVLVLFRVNKNHKENLAILALLYAIATLANSSNMTFVVRLIATLLQGMYFGIITSVSLPISGEYVQLNSLWPTFFMMVIPAMLTSWLAYFLGLKNFRFFSFLGSKKPPVDQSKIKK
jgi:hypothetical protein